MRFLIIIIFIFCIDYARGQISQEKEFLTSFFRDKAQSPVYSDEVQKLSPKQVLQITADTIKSATYFYKRDGRLYSDPKLLLERLPLTKEEVLFLKAELQTPVETSWPKGLIENAKMFSKDSIEKYDSVFGWSSFFPKFGRGVYVISRPTFIRNNSICFFFYSYRCGSLCAETTFSIFRKVGDKWEEWLILDYSVS